MNPTRNQYHKKEPITIKRYVLYWMQQSQRVSYNHALEVAIEQANELNLPLLIYFGLTTSYPEANERHYRFMLEGLVDVIEDCDKMGVGFCLIEDHPTLGIRNLLKDTSVLIMDKGYLRHQRQWRTDVNKMADEQGVEVIIEVESDVIVPVQFACDKEAYAARTLRPRNLKQIADYLEPVYLQEVKVRWSENILIDQLLTNRLWVTRATLDNIMKALPLDRSVKPSRQYHGGYKEAFNRLIQFLEDGLDDYDVSNNPGDDFTSKLSMYLHFGHISPVEIYNTVSTYWMEHPDISETSVKGYLEQLVVRRELAMNYVTYREGYDSFENMTYPWAYATMADHWLDERPYLYTIEQLVNYETHDPYWNTAMKEMVETGYMHNYMRMYWCKKIMEWTNHPKEAYDTALFLNNKYFIDGRDPNSYVGIAWCFGLHDHGWQERQVFGKLRYMNDKGLVRKFDMEAYRQRIDQLCQ